MINSVEISVINLYCPTHLQLKILQRFELTGLFYRVLNKKLPHFISVNLLNLLNLLNLYSIDKNVFHQMKLQDPIQFVLENP